MKRTPEYIEGPEAAANFTSAMKTILSMSKEKLLEREDDYRYHSALNPNRRGPKLKLKSASPASPASGAKPRA
jgi:hypothetical protein